MSKVHLLSTGTYTLFIIISPSLCLSLPLSRDVVSSSSRCHWLRTVRQGKKEGGGNYLETFVSHKKGGREWRGNLPPSPSSLLPPLLLLISSPPAAGVRDGRRETDLGSGPAALIGWHFVQNPSRSGALTDTATPSSRRYTHTAASLLPSLLPCLPACLPLPRSLHHCGTALPQAEAPLRSAFSQSALGF